MGKTPLGSRFVKQHQPFSDLDGFDASFLSIVARGGSENPKAVFDWRCALMFLWKTCPARGKKSGTLTPHAWQKNKAEAGPCRLLAACLILALTSPTWG